MDVRRSRFVANDVKSQWVPVQSGKLLGYVLNLHAGTFQVPQRRVDAFHRLLKGCYSSVKARANARKNTQHCWAQQCCLLLRDVSRCVQTLATSQNMLGL